MFAIASILGIVLAADGYAVDPPPPSGGPDAAITGSEQAMTAGVVRKVDKNAGKVTISHEQLRNLGMPKMTMVFRVKDPAMLDRLKEGDKIRFVAEKVNGLFTVTHIEPSM